MDAMLKMMFETQVVPLMKQMPTDDLVSIRAFVNEQVDKELLAREVARRVDAIGDH